MDVSVESKSLPSVGYSRKSYLQVTSQRLARGKLVHLHGWRSLALPSVGPGGKHNTVQKGCEIISQQKGDFATLCKILPSAWSDRLAMAVTPSFQLRIAYRLKHWIFDFLSFEMISLCFPSLHSGFAYGKGLQSFVINGRHGILGARHIVEALHIPYELVSPADFREWSHFSQRDMVRILSRGTSTHSFLLRKELQAGMLLVDVVLRSNIFPLQHMVERR
ncbi:hypothetical protein CK203_051735 [Vitis vinifera]|uniref:Uncharacterized protein n=1 Tax=Vitis vinifera TaxID=29760 RepID=A0A438HG90_VITVI|nr:hypothetical protein CK203_051735 [Vitis vinifera]